MDFSFSGEQEMPKTMARDFWGKECLESFVTEMEDDVGIRILSNSKGGRQMREMK